MHASSLNKPSSQEGLKPCPFCGGTAELSEGRTGDDKPWLYIECTTLECGAIADPEVWNTRHPSFNDAIEAWQPIETAPKDATEIIGLLRPKVIRLVWWFAPSSRSQGWRDENSNLVKPTHWMSLPEPPRSLKLPDYMGGEAKTAESNHSPSTLNAETE